MKKIIPLLFSTIALLSTASMRVSAQSEQPSKDLSNVEKFNRRSGKIFQKEFIPLGVVKTCEVTVYRTTDLISKEKISGVRFSYEHVSRGSSDTKIAVLDADEIDGLIKSIEIIKSNVLPVKPENYTEVTFASRSGFEAGCFGGKDNKDWSAYIKLEKYDSRSFVFLESAELESIIPLLVKAKTLL